MTPYVMFGHGPLLGDIADILRATGGRLTKVVQNIPESVRPRTKSLAQLVAEQEQIDGGPDHPRTIEVEALDEFRPADGERYLIGFRGEQMAPLVATVRERFRLTFPVLCHPTAVISRGAIIGEGTIIGAGAVVAAGVRVGCFALLNRGCTVGHDSVLEDFANVGPGANLASFTTVGRSAFIGIGETIINWVRVGDRAVVAAGAVVLRDVLAETLVAGVPAEQKKSLARDNAVAEPAFKTPPAADEL